MKAVKTFNAFIQIML